jgi:hypothetical protein
MSNIEAIERTYQKISEDMSLEWFDTINGRVVEWYNYILGLPEHQRVIYEVVLLDNQVSNGGFDQYFYNRYGQFSKTTIESLLKIGAIQKADLLKQALFLVNNKNYPYDEFRRKLVSREIEELIDSNELENALDKLDDKYYSNKQEDLIELLNRYLTNTPIE